jgi:hypothetical protein
VELSGDRLTRVAEALGFPVDFFLTDIRTAEQTACTFPRKRSSLSAERRIRALLQLTRLQLETLTDGARAGDTGSALSRGCRLDQRAEMALRSAPKLTCPTHRFPISQSCSDASVC